MGEGGVKKEKEGGQAAPHSMFFFLDLFLLVLHLSSSIIYINTSTWMCLGLWVLRTFWCGPYLDPFHAAQRRPRGLALRGDGGFIAQGQRSRAKGAHRAHRVLLVLLYIFHFYFPCG